MRGGAGSSLLPAEAAEFFVAEGIGPDRLDAGFAVLVVTSGSGELSGDWGGLALARGATVVVPFAAGACALSGSVAGVVCRPAE